MIEYLDKYFTEKGYNHTIDQYGNVYVTKGEADVYPCVIAHTDTVHSITEMVVEEEQLPNVHGELKDSFKAYHAVTGKPVGIGGDDKCGVYSCLDVLDNFLLLKRLSLYLKKQVVTVHEKQVLSFSLTLVTVFSLMLPNLGW